MMKLRETLTLKITDTLQGPVLASAIGPMPDATFRATSNTDQLMRMVSAVVREWRGTESESRQKEPSIKDAIEAIRDKRLDNVIDTIGKQYRDTQERLQKLEKADALPDAEPWSMAVAGVMPMDKETFMQQFVLARAAMVENDSDSTQATQADRLVWAAQSAWRAIKDATKGGAAE